MKKHSQQSTQISSTDQLEVVLIKKSNGICSKQIKLKLPPDTTFGSIIKFMFEQGLLKTKNAVIRPSHNQSYIIGNNRKIQECVNLIKLKFIVQELDDNKAHPGQKVQALRNTSTVDKDASQKSNICGREQCRIMRFFINLFNNLNEFFRVKKQKGFI